MEHHDSRHEKRKSLQNNLAIPIAIVIAGALIATALYLGPSKGSAIAGNNQAPQVAGRQAPAQAGKVKPVDFATDHIKGDKNAKVFVIEYSDFECPFCKRFHPTMQQLIDQYQGKVAWVYRHFPLSFHANAQKEAEASECAGEQGGNDTFWKYADKILERTTSNGTGFALTDLVPLAKEIGLDDTKFKSCLDSGKYAKHVQQDEQEGQAAGVTGTPGNIIWTKYGKSQLISGAVPLSSLTTVIDQVLK
jgi:protein-disulfide isomerase